MTIIIGDARQMDLDQFQLYQIIVSDNPWFYNDQRKVRKDGKTPTRGIGACHHYSQLTVEELCAMPIGQLAAQRCHLYLWATCPLLPDALQVMTAWGFKYVTVAFVWVKLNPSRARAGIVEILQQVYARRCKGFLDWLTFFGPGYYTGSNIELVLLGRQGKPFYHAKGQKAPQVIYAPRGSHSKKPEVVQDAIERMYPNVTPRLELFARRNRIGWDVFGDEIVLP